MNEKVNQRVVFQSRFMILLGMLIALLLITPIVITAGLSNGFYRIVLSGFFIGVLISSVLAVWTQKKQIVVVAFLITSTIVLQLVVNVFDGDIAQGISNGVGIVTLIYVISLLLGHLFSNIRVTADTIAASLCVYLLLGVLWSMIYTLIDLIAPGSFMFAYAEDTAQIVGLDDQKVIFSLYLSFTTLSTLGYGDVVPVSNPARMFAVVEAITGQVYLAVLVARLVGMHIASCLKN